MSKINDQLIVEKNKRNPIFGFLVDEYRYLIPAWWPMLLKAFLTIDWSAFGWFEWNLGFLSTVAAGDLVHLSWTTVVPAPLSITHNFHS